VVEDLILKGRFCDLHIMTARKKEREKSRTKKKVRKRRQNTQDRHKQKSNR
jgi:hypothetical protein